MRRIWPRCTFTEAITSVRVQLRQQNDAVSAAVGDLLVTRMRFKVKDAIQGYHDEVERYGAWVITVLVIRVRG